MATKTTQDRYWRANLRLLIILISSWFIVSFGIGIWFSDFLDQFEIEGFPLGFWSAQLLSILMLVLFVFIYVIRINYLDKKIMLEE